MHVHGFYPLLFSGLAGAFLFELFRVLAYWRDRNSLPRAAEWAMTVTSMVVGALVPLLYGPGERTFLEAA